MLLCIEIFRGRSLEQIEEFSVHENSLSQILKSEEERSSTHIAMWDRAAVTVRNDRPSTKRCRCSKLGPSKLLPVDSNITSKVFALRTTNVYWETKAASSWTSMRWCADDMTVRAQSVWVKRRITSEISSYLVRSFLPRLLILNLTNLKECLSMTACCHVQYISHTVVHHLRLWVDWSVA